MNNTNSKHQIPSNSPEGVNWNDPNNTYFDISECKSMMRKARLENRWMESIEIFKEYKIIVMPYIRRFLTHDQLKVVEDMFTIEKLQQKLLTNRTQYEQNNNSKVGVEICNELREKCAICYTAEVKAGLGIPIKRKDTRSILEKTGDNFVDF